MAITILYTIFFMIYGVFLCDLMSFFKAPALSSTGGHCREKVKHLIISYGHGAVVLLSDVTLAMIPFMMVHKMRMNRATKATIVSLLALGSM